MNKLLIILQKLEIPNSTRFMANMYSGIKGDIFRKSLGNDDIKNIQMGGAEKFKILNYHGVDFKFLIYNYTGSILAYALHILNNKDKLPECIVILIYKKENTAQIEGISQQIECYTKEQRETLKKSNINVSGALLMSLALKLIIKIKNEYNIKYIVLQDNSHKMCEKINIRLGLMYTLLNGKTWYSKFGFMPGNMNNNDVDEFQMTNIKKNQKIIENILVKDVSKFLIKYLLKYDSKIKASEMIKTKEDFKLSDFLRQVLKTKDGCKLFESFYRQLADKIGVTDFFAQSFILKFK